MLNLLELPDEILLLVFQNLEVKNVALARFVCKRFNAVSKLDPLWKHFSLKDFGISDDQLWDGWRFIEFFQRVLYPFRFMLGWWQRSLLPYGGVFKVVVERDGIHCYECLPPLDPGFLTCDALRPYIQRGALTPSAVNFLGGNRNNAEGEMVVVDSSDSEPEGNPSDHWIRIGPKSDYSLEGRYGQRYHRIFSLKNVGRDLRVYCYQSFIGLQDGIGHRTCERCHTEMGHDCGVSCEGNAFIEQTRCGFKLICENKLEHDYLHFNYWFELEHGFVVSDKKVLEKTLASLFYHDHYYIRVKKFDCMITSASYYDFLCPLKISKNAPEQICGLEPLPPPDFGGQGELSGTGTRECVLVPGAPVLPGLYCGTYSVHGWEMLNLKYEKVRIQETAQSEEYTIAWVLTATKITGDPNVPASRFSFRVFLHCPLHLSGDEDSESINELVKAAQERQFTLPVSGKEFQNQKFGVPSTFVERLPGTPAVCRGRFLAQGQVAGENFHNPSLVDCVFSFFDDRSFAIFWLELRALALFYRCRDQPETGIV